MKRILPLILALVLVLALFSGCETENPQKHAPVVIEKIEPENAVFEVGEKPAAITPAPRSDMDDEVYEIARATLNTVFEDYREGNPAGIAFDLSTLYADKTADEIAAMEQRLIEEFRGWKMDFMSRAELAAKGAWVTRTPMESGTHFKDMIFTLKLSAYENIDRETEYIIDIQRSGNTLRTLRYIAEDGTPELTGDTRAMYYDGRLPGDTYSFRTPTLFGHEKTMYFSGSLFKTGIKEAPVLGGIDFNVQLDVTVVEGETKGGFAGMLQGSVTIDGNEISLTADTKGMTIPLGLIDNPANYYLAFSRVAVANPQDTTAYRHVYFVNKGFSEIIGYYQMTLDAEKLNSWFVLTRTDKATFTSRTDENHDKLLDLYTNLFITAHGSRDKLKQLVIPSNMLIGTRFDPTSAALKKNLKSIAETEYEYYYALFDETVAREGLTEGVYFFPNARTSTCRLYEYDGTTAIVAIDFSAKENDGGYGGLYRATYADGAWTFEALTETRIS